MTRHHCVSTRCQPCASEAHQTRARQRIRATGTAPTKHYYSRIDFESRYLKRAQQFRISGIGQA
jgi:hypothetical protein